MLTVRNINKTYSGGIKALNNISLDIQKGVFGLLGPNGAGKSTFMRTLASLQKPDEGSIQLGDIDVINSPLIARRKIGYLPQDLGVYPRVSAYEMLDYLAGLKGIEMSKPRQYLTEQLDRVNLADVAHRRLDTYSGGMRRRFGIASAFLGDPELVIVDEPTAGLDPSERRRFQLLLATAAENCVMILSSHIVEDLAGLCTNMALINKGKIIKSGSPNALVASIEGRVWTRTAKFSELPNLQKKYRVLSWRPQQGNLLIRILSEQAPEGFTPAYIDLEDLYSVEIAADH